MGRFLVICFLERVAILIFCLSRDSAINFYIDIVPLSLQIIKNSIQLQKSRQESIKLYYRNYLLNVIRLFFKSLIYFIFL